jgi:hypothetical protein
MKRFLKYISLLAAVALVAVGCLNDDVQDVNDRDSMRVRLWADVYVRELESSPGGCSFIFFFHH